MTIEEGLYSYLTTRATEVISLAGARGESEYVQVTPKSKNRKVDVTL